VSVCFKRALLLIAVMFAAQRAAAPESRMTAQKQAEQELLALHKEERRAHFEHDVEFLVAHAGRELLDVREGRVNRMTRDDVRKRFVEYFKSAHFSAWDDLEPPIVQASLDGKLGWVVVRVRIAYTETDASGRETREDSSMAWMSAYEKQDGQWVLKAVTSTAEAR
jgi:hypothetical protein